VQDGCRMVGRYGQTLDMDANLYMTLSPCLVHCIVEIFLKKRVLGCLGGEDDNKNVGALRALLACLLSPRPVD